MYKILCLNKISPTGTRRLGEKYTFSPEMKDPQGILVRSASMHDMDLPKTLLAIARAGAGTNNVPVEACAQKGIAVFNTPGANANAVKELAICAMLLSSRKIAPAIEWVKGLKGQGGEMPKLIEKGKSQFAGPELLGKNLGVLGLGAIGILVANAALSLGMEVYGYDPFLSVEGALRLSRQVHRAMSLDEIYQNCDYITLHLPTNADTKGMIGREALAIMKAGVRLINLARGELVDSAAMLEALDSEKVSAYATDFPDEALLCAQNLIPLPHLGASTPESEDNCALMAVDRIKDYLENGNIVNSVNLPGLSMAREPGTCRVCIIHKNVPGAIANFTSVCSSAGINIENMQSKSRGEYAYTILDVRGGDVPAAAKDLQGLEAIIRVRVID